MAARPPWYLSPRGPFLLVANKGNETLGDDPVAGRQVATIRESGMTGHEVVASDGRTAYVPIYGDSGVGGRAPMARSSTSST